MNSSSSLLLSGIAFRPVLEKIVILIRRAQRPQWQGSRAARYSINSGQAADAANEATPPLGKVTSTSRVGLIPPQRELKPLQKLHDALLNLAPQVTMPEDRRSAFSIKNPS